MKTAKDSLEAWKKDEFGCKGIRNITFANNLIVKYKLSIGKTEKEVIEILGPSEMTINSENKVFRIFYFTNSNCNRNNPCRPLQFGSGLEIYFDQDGKTSGIELN